MNRHKTYKDIMSGVSQVIPFAVAGGILLALSFLVESVHQGTNTSLFATQVALFLGDTGQLIITLVFPILAGYIAFSIADRPGLFPGFLAGALAYTGGSGFFGALLGGIAAGYIMLFIKWLCVKLPRSMQSLKPVFIFPLLGALSIALFMIPLNLFVAPVTTTFLHVIHNTSTLVAIIIGCIAGAMMAYDMGGPVNKIAYIFGVASLSGGTSSILMASIMAAGMTPPLGIALATSLFKHKFSDEQLKAGKANWMMGISFMTEGALPFALSRPKVYIPAIMAGSILAAAVVSIFRTSVPAPHGGLFVVFVMENWWGFLIALGAGTLLTACLLFIFLKTPATDLKKD